MFTKHKLFQQVIDRGVFFANSGNVPKFHTQEGEG
jgi:hypothetical protein